MQPMKQEMFSLKLTHGLRVAIARLAIENRVSQAHVVREAVRAQYGIADPHMALAVALATPDHDLTAHGAAQADFGGFP
jgi:hypothetical protein